MNDHLNIFFNHTTHTHIYTQKNDQSNKIESTKTKFMPFLFSTLINNFKQYLGRSKSMTGSLRSMSVVDVDILKLLNPSYDGTIIWAYWSVTSTESATSFFDLHAIQLHQNAINTSLNYLMSYLHPQWSILLFYLIRCAMPDSLS